MTQAPGHAVVIPRELVQKAVSKGWPSEAAAEETIALAFSLRA